jgi:hypothetical protein
VYTFSSPNICDISTCLQLVCNCISIWNLKFGRKTFQQMTNGSISTYLPQYMNNLHVLMLMGFCFCSWRLKVLIFVLKEVEGSFLERLKFYIRLLIISLYGFTFICSTSCTFAGCFLCVNFTLTSKGVFMGLQVSML